MPLSFIARSNEAKSLGIRMGTPYHSVREIIKRENITVFSSCASLITVFIRTNPHRQDSQYSNSITISLPQASQDTTQFIHYALLGLQHIFHEGYAYQKVGVMLSGFTPKAQRQLSVFAPTDEDKKEILMLTLDSINARFGRDTVKIAQTGIGQSCQTQRQMLSPSYTTCWDELLEVRG